MELTQYWQRIQERICVRCVDGDGLGGCRLPASQECPISAFLPEIVVTVANTQTDSYETSINVLRRHVCILCDSQDVNLACKKRNDLECALDRYYPLVIETLETVRAEMERVEAR